MRRIMYMLILILLIGVLAAGCTAAKKEVNKQECIQKEFIAGTVVSFNNGEITLNTSDGEVKYAIKEGKTIFVMGSPNDIKAGVFFRMISKEGIDYIYVVSTADKKKLDDGSTSIFAVLKEAGDDYLVLNINGAEERYKVTDKTVLQKFSDSDKVMLYNKSELRVQNWVMVLVDKNNEVLNIVY